MSWLATWAASEWGIEECNLCHCLRTANNLNDRTLLTSFMFGDWAHYQLECPDSAGIFQVYLNLHLRISDVVWWIEGFHSLQCLNHGTWSPAAFLSIIAPTVFQLNSKNIKFMSESQTGHEVQDVYESSNSTDRVWESFGFLVAMSFGGEGFSFNTGVRNGRIVWLASWVSVWAQPITWMPGPYCIRSSTLSSRPGHMSHVLFIFSFFLKKEEFCRKVLFFLTKRIYFFTKGVSSNMDPLFGIVLLLLPQYRKTRRSENSPVIHFTHVLHNNSLKTRLWSV